jgi:hypothetical protein
LLATGVTGQKRTRLLTINGHVGMLRSVHETILGKSAEQFETEGSHSDPVEFDQMWPTVTIDGRVYAKKPKGVPHKSILLERRSSAGFGRGRGCLTVLGAGRRRSGGWVSNAISSLLWGLVS